MKAKVIPFQPWHLYSFEQGEHFVPELQSPYAQSYVLRQLDAVTILIDDHIIAIMGIMPMWVGVCEATFIPSQDFYKYKKTAIKELRKALSNLQEWGYNRIQATCREDRPKHGRFLEFLGFEWETDMPKYGPDGSTRCLYALIKED